MPKSESNCEMNEFCVYMHLNRINGKRYIGITSSDPLARWANGHGYYKNKHFYDAILRYGWDSFEHIILYTGLSKEEACEKETELIAKYVTQDKRYGYNITSGGEHFKHSEESKKLMSAHRTGKNCRKKSVETIQKMKENHAGGTLPKSVMCVESGKVYHSINDASRDTGINKKQISGCCRGDLHYNTAGGLHWQYMN